MPDITENPNIPNEFIGLNAYNLMPGATFMVFDEPDPRVWITERVSRDVSHERVYIWGRDATETWTAQGDLSVERAFDFHYCTKVALVGLVVNPSDPDDNDWGV